MINLSASSPPVPPDGVTNLCPPAGCPHLPGHPGHIDMDTQAEPAALIPGQLQVYWDVAVVLNCSSTPLVELLLTLKHNLVHGDV